MPPQLLIKCGGTHVVFLLPFLQGTLFSRLNLRVFNDPADPEKMWKASVKDIDGEILCVSQFTLFGNTTKGNKPDFHRAMVRIHPQQGLLSLMFS
jgi:D-Tyr-tRNAtyr deacylase